MRWKPTLIVVAGMLLASCSRTTGTAEISCSLWRPITWSSKDTPQTITEVKANNARRKVWCD